MKAPAAVLAILLLALPYRAPAADACTALAEVTAEAPARRLLEALDAATALVERLGPEAPRACAAIVPSCRLLVQGLYPIGEYAAAERACVVLERTGGLGDEDRLPCARTRSRLGLLREARALLDQHVAAAGVDPRNRVRALLEGSAIFEETSRFDAAAEILAVAASTAPDDLQTAARRVRVLVQAGRAVEAASVAEAAARRSRGPAAPLLREACVRLVRHGEAARGRAVAYLLAEQPAIEIADLDAAVAVARALKDQDLARKAADRFVSGAAARDAAQALRDATAALERHGFASVACRMLEASLASRPDAAAEEWLRLGHLRVVAGRREDAAAAFRRYLRDSGGTPADYHAVADEWTAARMPSRAVEFLREAVERSPASLELVIALGRALRDAGDGAGEKAAYAAAARAAADPAALWLEVGAAYLARPDAGSAEEAYRTAVAAAGTPLQKGLAHAGLADAIAARDRKARDAAEKELLAALEAAGDEPSILERVQKAAGRLGMPAAVALAVLERKAHQSPDQPELWWQIGLAHATARHGRDARRAFERFVAIAPDRSAAVVDSIGAMLDARLHADALDLLRRVNGAAARIPRLAERVGRACLEIGDRACMATHVEAFLSGPVRLDYDYLALADSLLASGLRTLAGRAVETARRTLPPERRFEVEMAEAGVALAGRRWDDAEAAFAKATVVATARQAAAARIAREYATAGRLADAARWYQRAAAEGDAQSRVQVLPAWIEVSWRLGRTDDVRRAARLAAEAAPSNAGLAKAAATALARAGQAAEAANVLAKGLEGKGARDRAEMRALQVRLLLLSGRHDEAASTGAAACRAREDVEAAETECLEVCRKLADGLRPDLAIPLLKARSDAGGPRADVELATLLLRTGDRAGALEAARRAADRVAAPSDLIRALGPGLAAIHAWEAWLGVLDRLVKRPAFAADPELLVELGRAQLASGSRGGAMLAFEAYLGATRGGEVRVYRELAAADARTEGVRVLEEAKPSAVAAIDSADLRGAVEDLAQWGLRDVASRLLDRYRAGNDGIAAADEVVGRIQGDLGWHPEAIATLRKVADARLTGPGRVALARSLWATGAREEALRVALAGVKRIASRSPSDEAPSDPWIQEALDLLVAEDAPLQAASLIERVLRETGGAPAMRLARARLLARSLAPADAAAGREEFLAALADLHAAGPEVLSYVRSEARAGSLPALRAALAEGPAGRTRDVVALFAACLAGDLDATRGMTNALCGTGADPDSRGALAAAEVLLECGRWGEAADAAAIAVRELPGDQDPEKAARITAVASKLAGRRDVAAAVERMLAARSDDPFARLAGVAELRAVLGDTAGVAQARAALAEASPLDPSIRLAAFESAVQAGDDAACAAAARAMLATTEDRATGLQRLLAASRKALRDELVLPALRDTLRAFPADGALRWSAFEAAARAGAWGEAEAAAKEWEALSASPRRAAAEVVATASAQLGAELVDGRLAALEEGLKDATVSRGLVFASFLAFRVGRTAEGTRLAEAAASLAPDPAEVAAIAAQDALVDADVPPGAAESAVAVAARAGRDPSALPVVAAARCLLLPSDGETLARCAERLQGLGWKASGLVAAAAARSLAAGDVVLATTLAGLASGMDGSRPLRVHLASQVMTCLGAASSADPADRRRAGEEALASLETPGLRPDPSLGVVRTHLVEMARGLAPAMAGYEAELRWAPADAGLHNNLGYLVEIAGGDLDLAVRSARVAEVLMSSSNGFYVETEAWAEFLKGRTREALGLQERARRLWSLEQDGGLAESFVHLGRMLEKAGRAAEAREAYRRAATLEPTRCAAREALARWRALGVGAGGESR